MKTVYCPRCGNNQLDLFGMKNGHHYCRACLDFNKPVAPINVKITPLNVELKLEYSLTEEQKKLAESLFIDASEIYVRAVCGAGKTEITYSIIQQYLKQGMRVGIAIPRKEIVKELYTRLAKAFVGAKIVAIYGGHDEELDGDIVILTTHQCYRYPGKFGLLIIDEYDAFPFANNPVLKRFATNSCYGKSIYLSATFSDDEVKDKVSFELNKRYHNQKLPLPNLIICNPFISYVKLIKYLKKNKSNNRYFFIYVPTIKEGIRLSRLLTWCRIQNLNFSSHSVGDEFYQIKEGLHRVVVTTTILERGITIKNLQVIVIHTNHSIFDFKTLVQIAGRVGRHQDYSQGDILLFAQEPSLIINQVIQHIRTINAKMSRL